MKDQNNARFQLKDGRITRIKELPKVRFLSVMCQAGKYPSYYDVTSFDDAHGRYREGDAVTVSGELQMRKPKEGGKYTLQLVARTLSPGDDAKAPRPRQQAERAPDASPEPEDGIPW